MNQRIALAALAAAASLALPGAAAAKGGSRTPPPPPAPFTLDCFAHDGPTADGGYVFGNQVGSAGCVEVKSLNGRLNLYEVHTMPDWTYRVVYDGFGTTSLVKVDFTNTRTGAKASARIELGKTDIRG
jgi:hypothetical protein